MFRRDFIMASVGTVLSVSGGLAAAQSNRTTVVELLNFQCSRCRAVNEKSAQFEDAARAKGIEVRYAPVAWESQSIWPNRFYYAVRDLYPTAEHYVREVIFDGLQRDGMRFEDLAQVVSYMEQRNIIKNIQSKIPEFKLSVVVDRAAGDGVLVSEYKAARLLEQTGADAVPVFVWVVDGKVKKTISPADAQEPQKLAQLVLTALG